MPPLGNLVRLAAMSIDMLPTHPDLPSLTKPIPSQASRESSAAQGNTDGAADQITKASSSVSTDTIDESGRPSIGPFVKAVLDEAIAFIDGVPTTFKPMGTKASKPSESKVQVLSHDVTADQLSDDVPWSESRFPRKPPQEMPRTGESWFARRSRHLNLSGDGTAKFEEFELGLASHHAENEANYTPAIFDTYRVLQWDIPTQRPGKGPQFDNYSNVDMSGMYDDCSMVVCPVLLMHIVYEMCHKLPFPLMPRVFPVLVISAMTNLTPSPDDFIVVQIPVDIQKSPKAFYSNGRNCIEGDTPIKRKKAVIGFVVDHHLIVDSTSLTKHSRAYTSIERCSVKEGQVEWTMATASDTNGWLPMTFQKMGVPGAITKDVGSFMKWMARIRQSRGEYSQMAPWTARVATLGP
ncbi:MAG: hypothetical protein Q9174_000527 [Haloplaca sp. 1 TL-2023]